MTQLTEERFEQLLDKKLGATETRIIKRIDAAQEELARMVADTVAEPFTKRFDELEVRGQSLRHAGGAGHRAVMAEQSREVKRMIVCCAPE